MTDQYGVMGNPISHSKSPLIHKMFAEQTEQDLEYRSILVPLNQFASSVDQFIKEGGKGLNITLPFKEQAYQYVKFLKPRAARAGAVNTIIINKAGETEGDNTDGVGLCRDLIINLKFSIKNSRILILGAGGATRGILYSLLDENPLQIHIANRTLDKTKLFANHKRVTVSDFQSLENKSFDLIINATSAGLTGNFPSLPDSLFDSDPLCYDLMYRDELTPFLQIAKEAGVKRTVDGIGMLVEQAAESFYLWRGVRPQTNPVIERFVKRGTFRSETMHHLVHSKL